MSQLKELVALPRTRSGKGAARAERRAGRVPAVIYGGKEAPVGITLNYKEINQRIYAGHFLTTLYNIEVEGKKILTLPKSYQLDPVKDFPIHVDFLRVDEKARITVQVPVHILNEATSVGMKKGGTLNFIHHHVEVSCLATQIPDSIDIDIAKLEMGESIHAKEVTLPAGVKFVDTTDFAVVAIAAPGGKQDKEEATTEA